MSEQSTRMTQPDSPPTDSQIGRWIGKDAHKYWKRLAKLIDKAYPDVFVPEWLFGGRKSGWYLRYKKSRSFCTFTPEKNRFMLLIVFRAKEREKVEAMKDSLSQRVRKAYDDATTYHDGKWLFLTVDSDRIVDDVMRLLATKRRPK